MATTPAVLGPNTRLNNFRLNYLTAAQAADRPTHIRIILGGIDVTRPDSPTRVIYKSMTIRDLVFDAPNTCALTLYGAAPNVGAPIEVWINSNAPALLFGGELQTVDKTYKGRPSTVLHPVTAIDDTARANRRRPLRPYVNVSASTIAHDLIASFAPGFSSAGVEGNLPAVSINFDGSEGGMKGCLTALAKLIGGYWYFEAKTLYFFVTPPGPSPDPIDDTPGRFLHDPQITWSLDKSQVRTRVYGKGASTRIIAAIAAGTDLVPIENGEMFNAVGGQAIAGITPDGAASRVLTYTGVQLGGGGGLVGPGAAPSAVPGLTLADGTGVESGVHQYALTFVTAAGESLPGPRGTITVGPIAPPASPPVPGVPIGGGAVDPGTHYYAVTFVTTSGETTSPPAWQGVAVGTSASSTVTPAPTTAPTVTQNGTGTYQTGYTYEFRVTFVTAFGETPAGPIGSGAITTGLDGGFRLSGLPLGPAGVTGRKIYLNFGYGFIKLIADNVTTTYQSNHQESGSGIGVGVLPPTGNTAYLPTNAVTISQIAIGPANVTARRLYRLSPGQAAYRLVTTIANNTATTYTDAAPSSALGAALPSVNTAAANQVGLTLPIGGTGVTGRKLYRTTAGGSALLLVYTSPNNTVGFVGNDATPDASLGAPAPSVDTSGLVQPSGQVPAGATSLILANPAPFAAGGGWAVVGNGEQVIRFTGKSASALTGIPATGPGAIVASISYNSTVTAAPALVGVTGILEAVIRNAPIHVWVQRDDLAAQAYMAALDGSGDGVYEHIWSDERRTEASLIQVCDAQLALYSRPLATVTYASRDLKTKSGKTVTIAVPTPAIHESLTIQDVTITELGIKGLAPKFTVTASNASTSFEAVLRMLIRKADA